jgi:hypothetical protein
MWSRICDAAEEQFAIRLRPALNIIGFTMFPVGWSWTECRPRPANALPFESDAEELGLLKVEPPAPQTKEGLQALRRSNRYRLAQAEHRLQRFIYRREVRVILITANGTKRDIDDRTRLDPTLSLDPKKDRLSVTRKKRRISWGFETDALDLVKALETKLPWNGNNTVNDWLRLERFLRELFETHSGHRLGLQAQGRRHGPSRVSGAAGQREKHG